jgi:hypothetical protein
VTSKITSLPIGDLQCSGLLPVVNRLFVCGSRRDSNGQRFR